jgi:hypothetical protein
MRLGMVERSGSGGTGDQRSSRKSDVVPEDEPGMEERFQRALRKALNTPPKHRTAPKPKERPASKGRVHKGKTRS